MPTAYCRLSFIPVFRVNKGILIGGQIIEVVEIVVQSCGIVVLIGIVGVNAVWTLVVQVTEVFKLTIRQLLKIIVEIIIKIVIVDVEVVVIIVVPTGGDWRLAGGKVHIVSAGACPRLLAWELAHG